MIVCLCHRISDRDIERAARSGTPCFEALQDEILVASACGCCMDCAREIFDEAARALGPPPPTEWRALEPTTA